jgi:hypothetical protein
VLFEKFRVCIKTLVEIVDYFVVGSSLEGMQTKGG